MVVLESYKQGIRRLEKRHNSFLRHACMHPAAAGWDELMWRDQPQVRLEAFKFQPNLSCQERIPVSQSPTFSFPPHSVYISTKASYPSSSPIAHMPAMDVSKANGAAGFEVSYDLYTNLPAHYTPLTFVSCPDRSAVPSSALSLPMAPRSASTARSCYDAPSWASSLIPRLRTSTSGISRGMPATRWFRTYTAGSTGIPA